MAHVHAEVEKPPIKEDDTHLAAVRPYPNSGPQHHTGSGPGHAEPPDFLGTHTGRNG